ncbi:MAG TPA: ABC transporter permease [Pseudolabrys sp.]|nr:ABC transporter permease [Pseudolabrys sp.]
MTTAIRLAAFRRRLANSGPGWTLALPAVLFLLVFTVMPLGLMVGMSFWKSTIFGTRPDFIFDNYIRVFSNWLYVGQLINTLALAIGTTLVSLVVSYPIALMLSRMKGSKKSVFLLMLFIPFWSSYVVRTFVWLPILGRNGAINQLLMYLGIIDQPLDYLLYNNGAVVLGLVYVFTLFMTLPIYVTLDKLDPALIEAASDLGAKPLQVFARVIVPLSMPGVMSGSIMVFLMSVGAYVTPQLLGGPSGLMFGNIIAAQFLSDNNWAFGSALACSMMIAVLAILMIAGRFIGLEKAFSGGHG